jgi:WD40 repeat protein
LAIGGAEGTVWLRDLSTFRLIGEPFRSSPGSISAMAFSPDGTTLVTGGSDGTVRRWDVTYLSKPRPYLCASTGRSLTRAQWAHYAPGLPYQETCP